MEFYHEKQQGDLCRVHAINNFCGEQIVTKDDLGGLYDFETVGKAMPLCLALQAASTRSAMLEYTFLIISISKAIMMF